MCQPWKVGVGQQEGASAFTYLQEPFHGPRIGSNHRGCANSQYVPTYTVGRYLAAAAAIISLLTRDAAARTPLRSSSTKLVRSPQPSNSTAQHKHHSAPSNLPWTTSQLSKVATLRALPPSLTSQACWRRTRQPTPTMPPCEAVFVRFRDLPTELRLAI